MLHESDALVTLPFNNQPDAVIIQIYSVIKLYMFRASSLLPRRVRMENPDSAWKQASKHA
jgi:hypothetical protein